MRRRKWKVRPRWTTLATEPKPRSRRPRGRPVSQRCVAECSNCRAAQGAHQRLQWRRSLDGWGTWIRTRTSGVRVRGSTVKLSPTGAIGVPAGFGWTTETEIVVESPRSVWASDRLSRAPRQHASAHDCVVMPGLPSRPGSAIAGGPSRRGKRGSVVPLFEPATWGDPGAGCRPGPPEGGRRGCRDLRRCP